jgi:RecA/RadA recombinase
MTDMICYLQGRIVEIYRQEASGKTTLALHIIKEAQMHEVLQRKIFVASMFP